MLALSPAQLRKERKRIGMIFQHFNLMNSRTIADNVAFPLKGIKSKQAIQKKVAELLDLVGLTDRANSYPAQLSGGQKQRVGIAARWRQILKFSFRMKQRVHLIQRRPVLFWSCSSR